MFHFERAMRVQRSPSAPRTMLIRMSISTPPNSHSSRVHSNHTPPNESSQHETPHTAKPLSSLPPPPSLPPLFGCTNRSARDSPVGGEGSRLLRACGGQGSQSRRSPRSQSAIRTTSRW